MAGVVLIGTMAKNVFITSSCSSKHCNFVRRGLDLDRMFLNANCLNKEPYYMGFPPTPNATLGVPELSFVESEFRMNRSVDRSGRWALFRPEKKTGFADGASD